MPLITPAIATRVKLLSGSLPKPERLTAREKKKPKNAPVISEGAKLPPLPPLLMVALTATALISIIEPIKTKTSHSLVIKSLSRLVLSNVAVFFSDNAMTLD